MSTANEPRKSLPNGADTRPSHIARDLEAHLFPLLKEYGEKLLDAQDKLAKAEEVIEDQRRKGLSRNHSRLRKILLDVEKVRRMVEACKELSAHSSQLLEHGKLPILARIELKLRLAEFESALTDTESLLRTSQPQLQ